VILLGDVGGTNVRLILKRIDIQDPESNGHVIKDDTLRSQEVRSFEESIRIFLKVRSNKGIIGFTGL
jgi:glucokinase